MRNRVLLIGIFLILSSSIVRANGITLLSAQEYVNQVCNANGVVDSMSKWVNAATTEYDCEATYVNGSQ
jgi:hypothetical protein